MTEPTPDPSTAAVSVDPEVLEQTEQLFDLAREGDSVRLSAHLDGGKVPLDLGNERGDTLLMLAAYHGHADTVRLLLQHGAHPDRGNVRGGQTPLSGAVFKGAQDVIDALLEGGADPSAGSPNAIDTARMFGKEDLLRQFGAG